MLLSPKKNLITKISKEEINLLPIAIYEGDIEVITTPSGAIKACIDLAKESVIGFDTESKPSFKKGESYPVSLLQLCTKDKAYLFRINLFKMPKELIEILSDPNILKVGIAIRDDLVGLKKLTPFTPDGFLELATLAKQLGIENLGLRSLAAILMNVRISKGAKLSNWEGKKLTKPQISYAATDAWVGRELYFHLTSTK